MFKLPALVLGLALTSQGGIVQTSATDATSETFFPAATNDLVNAGQPTLEGVAHTGYTPYSSNGTSSPTNLNDGVLGLPSGTGGALSTTAFDLDGAWTTTFRLDTNAAPYGYDIAAVRSLTGWLSPRVGQTYELLYSTVGAPDFYTSLGTFTLSAPGVSGSGQLQISNTTGAVAMNVKNVRFDIQAGYSAAVYRELDVFGAASTSAPPIVVATNIAPDDPLLSFSDYVQVSRSATNAAFNRIINAGSGMRWDNPAARIRVRTNASNLAARLYYNALHLHGARNSTGLVLRDGAVAATYTFDVRPGDLSVVVTNPAADWHTWELLLPFADSVEFRGFTVNEGAELLPVPPRPSTRYVAYGDSITQGYQATDPTGGYPYRIGTNRQWEVVNMGFGGRTAAGSDGTTVGGLGGHIITTLMGVNDAISGKTAAQFRTDYTNLIANIRRLQPYVPVYVITPLYTTLGGYGADKLALIDEYRPALSNIVADANDPNLHLVDGLTLGITSANMATVMPDTIHPNDAGFALVAANLDPLLSTVSMQPPRGTALALR